MLLDNLPNASTLLNSIFQAFPDLLFILDDKGVILDYKAGEASSLLTARESPINQQLVDILPPGMTDDFLRVFQELREKQTIRTIEYLVKQSGVDHWFEAKLIPSSQYQVIVVMRDISKHKLAEEKTQRQIKRLAALRAIDLAISSSLDLNLALSVVLSQITAQLNVDAAGILLLNPQNNMLEFASGVGFRTDALQFTQIRMGEPYAGIAALNQEVISIPNLQQGETGFLKSPRFGQEGFYSYFCVPLIAKGKVRGVLEIFQRTLLSPDLEWLDFMETLAGQAAIAVENAVLFKELQRTNSELTLAYNTTIEGWSHALDLRDRDTEGHTQRVTELAIKLAHRMVFNETELIDIQRGAVLHDIGKMAIPDNILLKPGPLTAEEWSIVRQHPRYAYELLCPISFLGRAMDIPFYHHEKWDGSGYPQGLRGDQIPLSARLFAVVDVYDALTSDRPYRPAWSKMKAIAHIRDQGGKHFDAKITDEFLKMLESEGDGE